MPGEPGAILLETKERFVAWAEENLPEGFTYSVPEAHHWNPRTSNACAPLNSQIKRSTRVVGLFPSEESLQRLVSAILVEISESWKSGKSTLKTQDEQKPKTTAAGPPSGKYQTNTGWLLAAPDEPGTGCGWMSGGHENVRLQLLPHRLRAGSGGT